MDKNKKIIIITCVIVFIIFAVFSFFSINKIIKNQNMKKEELYIVIIQKDENNNNIEIYKEKFTKELEYENNIESLIRKKNYNKVVIKDGKCYVTNTTCPTHSCESYVISLDDGIFVANTTISCLPNGLFISLETLTE